MGKIRLEMTQQVIHIFFLFIPLLLKGTIKRVLVGFIGACVQRECIYSKKTKPPCLGHRDNKITTAWKGWKRQLWKAPRESQHMAWGQPGCQCGCCASEEALPMNQQAHKRVARPYPPIQQANSTEPPTTQEPTQQPGLTRCGWRATTNKQNPGYTRSNGRNT